MRRRIVLVVAVALVATSAAADWLVLEDGSRVETAGPWEVEGRLVVFEMKDGTRASLRRNQVDLEASRAATEEALRQPEEPTVEAPAESELRHPNRRITNADIPPGESSRTAPAAPDGETEDDAVREERPILEGLEITSWEEARDRLDQHLVLRGRVVNRTSSAALGARVVAHVYDAEGGLILTGRSKPHSIQPAEGATFEIDLPDVFYYMAVQFEVEGTLFDVSGGEAAGTEGGEAGGEAAEIGAEAPPR